MADVEIKYNNATIASLDDSGTEVLDTNGTFLTDDITVEYTKSGGGQSNMFVEIKRIAVAAGYSHAIQMTAGDMKSALDQGISFVFWYPYQGKYYSLEYADLLNANSIRNVKLTNFTRIFTAADSSSFPAWLESGGSGN